MSGKDDHRFFDNILQHLQQTRGFDFTVYKRASLMRRLVLRMQVVGVETFEEYFNYLQVRPEEFLALFKTILINVTGFFRDPDVWNHIRVGALPEVFARRRQGDPFRVWSAGCASGQEAYTFLMVLGELLGLDTVRDTVKVYATDADEEALNEARRAEYPERAMEGVPESNSEVLRPRAQRIHVQARPAPVGDLRSPRSRAGCADFWRRLPALPEHVDVFQRRRASADSREVFPFAEYGGHLLLGRAEMLFSDNTMFLPVDLKHRLFKAIPRPDHRDRLLLLAQTGGDVASGVLSPTRLRDAAFESHHCRNPSSILRACSPARTHRRATCSGLG